MISLQFMQKELERVKGELKEKIVLIDSFLEAATARKSGGKAQEREPRKVATRWRYEIRV